MDEKRETAPSRGDDSVTPEAKSSVVPSFSGSGKSSAKSVRSSHKDVHEDPVQLISDGDTHRVTLTITVAVAYPKPTDEHSRLMEELVRRNKRTVEAPRANQFLHCEYTIAPKHERTVTDVVTYAVAAKVFTDTDSRVVKTWDDGRHIWVAWMHSHELEVTSKNVMSLYNHTIDMKIWDAKEKVSVKARTDRPKAFRLPSANDTAYPGKGVHGVVSKQSNSWLNVQPRDSVTDIHGGKTAPTTTAKLDEGEDEEKVEAEEKKDDRPSLRVRSSLGRLAGINASEEEKKRISELKRQQARLQKELAKNGKKKSGSIAEHERAAQKKETKDRRDTEGGSPGQAKKTRTADALVRGPAVSARLKPVSLAVKLENLFAGIKSVTSRLTNPNGSVRDALATITLDGPLLPKDLERSLNPLVLNLKAVKDLPNTPVPQQQLKSICKPVYCNYSFLDHPHHITTSRPHGKHVYFEDTHVILLGRLNDGEVREFIHSNSLQIEVHDRDQKENDTNGKASLFGEERFDNKLSNVGIVSSKRTSHNAFHSKKKAYDPFGIAKISLTDLLRGHTSLNLQAAVNPCPIPDLLKDPPPSDGNDIKLVGVPGAVDRPERPPQLPGHYIQAGTTLKMRITLRYPFVPGSNVPRLLPLPHQMCPFSRVVYYFNYKNKEFLHRVEEFVTRTNAKALRLDHFEKHVIDAALSTYKLTIDQKRSQTLDIITGFHIIDGNLHLMVLEGLREEGMQRLHDEVQRTETEGDVGMLVHLYDSSLSFSNRMYASLDVDLCRVRLHQTLPEIMRQPLLYVRDMVPRGCFDCLTKIHQITQLNRLRDVVHSNLFPTADMVISMSREFGIPLTYDDFEQHHKTETQKEGVLEEEPDKEVAPLVVHPGRRWTPIDNTNRSYETLLRQRQRSNETLDYVSTNIITVQEAGKRRRPLHPTVRSLTADIPAHNYSAQSLNTTELAKDILRDMLREEDPSARYAYHPSYNSAMVVPVNVDTYYHQLEEADKKAWRTTDGFVYPGMKSSRACNEHPLKPDPSRIDDLRLRFRDNVLHRNILEPTLTRDRMNWDERRNDIELYRPPVAYFGSSPPVTIHLAGQLRRNEQLQFKKTEEGEWRRRVVVDDPRMRFHRVLCATEQTNASNQLDRLTSLLKNEPKKLTLKRQPAPTIPPLSVVLNPSVDTAARARGEKLPPAFDESLEKHFGFAPGPYEANRWNMEANRIPIKDEEHERFANIHGHDINLYHKERSLLSKRIPIKSLTDDELKTHLFRIPPIPTKEKSDDAEGNKDGEVFGEGPHGKSEYRVMFPSHDVDDRLREIYPRHTFHGFGSLDGKAVARDASVYLMSTDEGLGAESGGDTHTPGSVRPPPGKMLPDEASVEISRPPNATLPVEVA